MNALKVQERTIYWNISAEKRAKVKRMKRKFAGWLMIGLPISMFLGFIVLVGGWQALFWGSGAIVLIAILSLSIDRGIALLRE